MTTSQIILVLLVAIVAYQFIKKFMLARSIKHYSPAEASEKVKTRQSVFLDVRTPTERSGQQIKGSLHIPVNELSRRVTELNKYKDKEIIVYCRSGSRSLNAAATLKKNGFNIANLKGGLIGWNAKRS